MSLLSAQLQAFESVARLGTVHGAAQELKLTQTGVTQRIRALEAALGITLFLRSRRGMRVTEEAEPILLYCRQALELEGQALNHLSPNRSEKSIHLSVAGPTSFMSSRLFSQVSPLYKKWPGLYVHFVVSDSENRLLLAKSAQSSLVVLAPSQVPREMDSKLLKADRYLLVASSRWKGRRLQEILSRERLIDFHGDDPTSLQYLKNFDLMGDLKRDRLFVNNNQALIEHLLAGVGFATLTQEVARPHIESGDLTALNSAKFLEDPLALAWYPRPKMPPYWVDLIKAIK